MTIDNLLLAVIAFVGALIFGITGFGSALVTIPLATHLVPLKFALALFALVDLACAVSVGLENPKNAVRAECMRMVPMILVGTALGVTPARQPAARRGHAAPRLVHRRLCAL
jgi:uncharacterized membrane protein YfcA